MILWHTTDGWLRPELKTGPAYETLRYLGSMAAPLFVTLAGAGAALKLCGDREKKRGAAARSWDLALRGLHVVAVGYALRVFMWAVDGRAVLQARYAAVWLSCALGLAAAILGLGRLSAGRRGGLILALAGVGAYAAGIFLVWRISPAEVSSLMGVDVLQAIGASIVIIALIDPLLGVCRVPWVGFLLGLGIAALSTPVELSSPPDLPAPLVAYIARFTTGPGRGLAMFPLLPWLGYALVGTSIGVLWYRGAARGQTSKTILWLLCASALVVVLTIADAPPNAPPMPPLPRAGRLLHKIGLGMVFTGVSYFLTRLAGRFPLRDLGKASLLIYCVHLELVYGLLGRPWVGALGYGGLALGFVVLTAAMAALAYLRLRGRQITRRASA
jgi:uncharacterized membrane protein